MIDCVIWDWNGTLLNDVEYAKNVINAVLKKHHIRELADFHEYREKFCFPVQTFYERVGLGGALYDEAAVEWTQEYYAHEADCALRFGAEECVLALKALGIRQAVISASPQTALERQVGHYAVSGRFEALMGLDNIHARSKVGLARDFMGRENSRPETTLFIGDTLHDAEVATAVGARCVLLKGGHQTEELLRSARLPLLDGADSLPGYIRSL